MYTFVSTADHKTTGYVVKPAASGKAGLIDIVDWVGEEKFTSHFRCKNAGRHRKRLRLEDAGIAPSPPLPVSSAKAKELDAAEFAQGCRKVAEDVGRFRFSTVAVTTCHSFSNLHNSPAVNTQIDKLLARHSSLHQKNAANL